ncbi:MAG: tyrosine-type recombinase/integrase [Betaproteobacteria bacterium]|nr:tyrosine-type recombinase/integrase [Betaproteobacteria bacterium]
MFAPAVFALTEVRGKNLAANTIGNVLRAVMAFQLFLDARSIDLDARLGTGNVLSLGEAEDLARLCRLPLADLAGLSCAGGAVAAAKVSSLEQARMKAQTDSPPQVDPGVTATRLHYIRAYIAWLARERLSRHGLDPAVAARLRDSAQLVSDALESRIPRKSSRASLEQREGLSDEDVAELLRVTDPHSPENPWRDQHTRYRNALLVRWLLRLGLRIGEALGVRNSDIVAYRGEVTIHRRADDPDDPRRNQPQTKTRARVLPLDAELLAQTQAYILNHRRGLPEAKKHPFLFVASRTGRPMSVAAAEKVFRELRKACPSLPKWLSPHVLRHTWNDQFSELMDARGVSPENESQGRIYWMGWSPNSDMAAAYTRRHVRNKAREVSLELQKQFVKKEKGDE